MKSILRDRQKIALINPPSPFLTNQRVFPNMGLVRVATQMDIEWHYVDLIDLAGKDPNEIKKIANDYDIYGFSSTTPQMPYTMNLVKLLKQENSNAVTILGGPHASAMYSLKNKGIKDINIEDLEIFDTIFAGEGEDTRNFFKLGWQTGLVKDLDLVHVPNRKFIEMNSNKYVNKDFVGPDSYNYDLFGKKTTSIQTQRGCPHQCSFCCGRDIEMYNKVRYHSPERVLFELDKVNKDYGIDSFQIYDDEVNINIKRLENLCKELSKRKFQFRAFIRNDQIIKYPKSIDWMKEAGFVKLCAGVESGSNRILKIINKKLDYKTNLKARQLIKEKGIHYEGFMILGHPSETLSDIKLTRKWLLEAKPDDFDLNLLTPYPGCKIYNDAIPSKQFKNYGWEWNGLYFNKERFLQTDSYYKGINKQSQSNIRTKTLSNQDLINIRNDLEEEVRSKLK